MSGNNFDWTQEDITCRSYGSIDVYENPNHDIVIRQEEPWHGHGDSSVIIQRYQAKIIIEALTLLVNGHQS